MGKRPVSKARVIAALLFLCMALAVAAVIAVVRDPDLVLFRAQQYLAGKGVAVSWRRAGVSFFPLRGFLDGATLSADGVSVFAARVFAEPDIPSALRGELCFSTLLARGLKMKISARQAAKPITQGPAKQLDLAFLRRIFLVKQMVVADSEIIYEASGKNLALRNLRISLLPVPGGARKITGSAGLAFVAKGVSLSCDVNLAGKIEPLPQMSLELDVRRGEFDSSRVKTGFSASTDILLTRAGVLARSFSLAANPVFSGAGKDGRGDVSVPLAANGSARFGFDDRNMELVLAEASAGSLAKALGKLEGKSPEALSGGFSVVFPDLAAALVAARPVLPKAADQLALSGSLPITMAISQGAFKAQADLSRVAASYNGASCELSGLANAEGQGLSITTASARAKATISYAKAKQSLSGDFPTEISWRPHDFSARTYFSGVDIAAENVSAIVSGELRLTGKTIAGLAMEGKLAAKANAKAGKIRVFPVDAKVKLSGTYRKLDLTDISIAVPDRGISVSEAPVSLGAVLARATGSVSSKGLFVDRLIVSQQDLGKISGKLSFAKGQGLFVTIKSPGISLPGAIGRVSSYLGHDVLSGFSVTGNAELSADYWSGKGGKAEVKATGLSFSSPDGAYLGQGIDVVAAGKTISASLPLALSASVSANKGELLAKTVYLDLSKSGLSAKFSGRLARTGIKRCDISADLGNMASATAKGDLAFSPGDAGVSANVRISSKNLSGLFTAFVAEPLAASRPELSKILISGGGVVAAGISKTKDTLAMTGTADIRSLQVSRKNEKALLENAALSLPFSCFFGKKPLGQASPPRIGSFSADNVRPFSGAETGRLSLPMTLWDNNLTIRGNVVLPLWGGAVTISDLTANNVFSPDFSGSLDLTVNKLGLAHMGTGGVKLSGDVSGRLSPVKMTKEKLTAAGDISGTFFGGKLLVSGISVTDPFSSARELGADLAIEKVDLLELTTALGAGTVSGKADIGVAGLRLAHGEPVAFRLSARSIREKGVPQDVSLAAVNSISVISSGQGITSLGVGLLTRIFPDFPYKELGFSCTLVNDVFSIRGLISENGVEYLVKRPFFRGINVVNRNRDNTISFSDMMKRVARVGKRGGKGDETGPH